MGGSVETSDPHMEGDGHHGEVTDSVGALPDLSTLSAAYRDDNNTLHHSLSYRDGGGSGPLIVNNSDQEPGGLCERDTSTLLSGVRSRNERHASPDNNADGGSHPIAGALMIVNACLGAGLLNFPSAFHEAGGVVAGNIVQAMMMIFIWPALLTLAYCSDWNKSKTLQETLASVWGRKTERASAICVALYCFGTCTTFLIIMGDQFDRIFASIYGAYFCHTWYLNRTFTTVAQAVVCILPFCYPKKIDFLKYISSLGVLAVLYVAFLIMVQYYRGIYTPGEIRTAPDSWTDLFLVVPSLCFAYQCHVSTIPIYSCFRTRNTKTFAWSSAFALSICIFVYTVAATCGYLTFGSKIASDILESYDGSDPLVIIAIIAILIKTYSTYPILSFCGNAAVCDLWVDSREAQGVLEVDPHIKNRFRLISVTIWFTLSLVCAVCLPNIGSVIKILGCFAAIFIFVFPGMCLLKMAETPNGITMYPKPRKFFLTMAGIFVCIGGFLFGVVITNAVIFDFIKVQPDPEPLCLPLPVPQ